MNKEYKKIYEIVNNLNFSCDYIKFKNGYYSLNIFSKDYNIFEGVKYNFLENGLNELKEEIIEIIKEYYKNKVLEDETGFIYIPLIKENKLFLYNGVNELSLNEFKKIKEFK